MAWIEMLLRGLKVLPEVVQGVEDLYGAKNGAEKRKAAIEMVGAAVGLVEAAGATQVVDPEKFSEALGVLVDGVVACLNASAWSKPGAAAAGRASV